MDKIKESLEKSRYLALRAWKRKDIKTIALRSIDTLCTHIEDGMDKDKALDLIYKFAHCSHESTCYDVHDDWRKDLKEFYKQELIEEGVIMKPKTYFWMFRLIAAFGAGWSIGHKHWFDMWCYFIITVLIIILELIRTREIL